jgi:hypothetical protein
MDEGAIVHRYAQEPRTQSDRYFSGSNMGSSILQKNSCFHLISDSTLWFDGGRRITAREYDLHKRLVSAFYKFL